MFSKIKSSYRKGISICEILMSTLALSILMLGFSQFTSTVFGVTADNSQQLKTVNQARFASERIITQISKAAYIYPANITISLGGFSINTSSSVAMLIEEPDGNYSLVAYYTETENNNTSLYEYISEAIYSWEENTCPASTMVTFTGTSSLIAKDISSDGMNLQYIMNYANAPSDKVLKGDVSNIVPTDTFALIKGISWNIVQDNDVIQIKGISRNVPRFFE